MEPLTPFDAVATALVVLLSCYALWRRVQRARGVNTSWGARPLFTSRRSGPRESFPVAREHGSYAAPQRMLTVRDVRGERQIPREA
jgi:hypothetical protein